MFAKLLRGRILKDRLLGIRHAARAKKLFGSTGTPSIAIIGAGLGGIGVAVKLAHKGIRTFTIFEKNPSAGGTWWENKYPGCEVDAESYLYSYSFKPYSWTRNFAKQPELLKYIEETIDEHQIRSHIRFQTLVDEIVWNESTHTYDVRTAGGQTLNFSVVISAVGLLNKLNYPKWEGLEDFGGPKFHTARWEGQHKLEDKIVAVVGTGCTAAQVVPALAPKVKRLILFQREPGYVLPKGARDFRDDEIFALRNSITQRIERVKCFVRGRKGRGHASTIPGNKSNTDFAKQALQHIDVVLNKRPDLVELVTPRYPYYGKRPIISDDFYPALLRDNVQLVPSAVERVTRSGVVDVTGKHHEVDVLVMATGFQPANFLAGLRVVGSKGKSIHDTWNNEPRAFLGTVIAGFPNFYMLYGPNSNGGEILFHEEAQATYIVRAINRMIRKGITAIEIRPEAMDLFNAWLQRRLRRSSFGQSVFGRKLGYYLAPTGRNVTQWHQGLVLFWLISQVSSCAFAVTSFSRRRASSDIETAHDSHAEVVPKLGP